MTSFIRLFFFLMLKFGFLNSGENEYGQLRRERIAERMKSLQELVPNANKVIPSLLNIHRRSFKYR